MIYANTGLNTKLNKDNIALKISSVKLARFCQSKKHSTSFIYSFIQNLFSVGKYKNRQVN